MDTSRIRQMFLWFSSFLFRLFSYSVEHQKEKKPRTDRGVTCFVMQTRFISKVQYMTINENSLK